MTLTFSWHILLARSVAFEGCFFFFFFFYILNFFFLSMVAPWRGVALAQSLAGLTSRPALVGC
jgi:hypothetical protein